MAAADVERLESIGTQTRWRTPNDCVGISRGELQDTSRTPAPRLPALGIPLCRQSFMTCRYRQQTLSGNISAMDAA